MYDTFIMLKPDASFTTDELHAIVADVMKAEAAVVERHGSQISVSAGSGHLYLDRNDSADVIEESNEIAARFDVPSQGCRSRFEMGGDDPDMELFNDYLLINERLQATGKFIIFDTQECKLVFE